MELLKVCFSPFSFTEQNKNDVCIPRIHHILCTQYIYQKNFILIMQLCERSIKKASHLPPLWKHCTSNRNHDNEAVI